MFRKQCSIRNETKVDSRPSCIRMIHPIKTFTAEWMLFRIIEFTVRVFQFPPTAICIR